LRPLVFMHVPKTSGMSITRGLATALAPTVAVGGFDYSLFGFSRDFSSLQDDLRCQIYTSPESMPKHANFVAGHISISTLTKAYPTAQRLTVLREPVSRVLSHWLYWRQLTEPELAPWGDWADFVSTRRPKTSRESSAKLEESRKKLVTPIRTSWYKASASAGWSER